MTLKDRYNGKLIEKNMRLYASLLNGVCKVECSNSESFDKYKNGLLLNNIQFEIDLENECFYIPLNEEYEFDSYGIKYSFNDVDDI